MGCRFILFKLSPEITYSCLTELNSTNMRFFFKTSIDVDEAVEGGPYILH